MSMPNLSASFTPELAHGAHRYRTKEGGLRRITQGEDSTAGDLQDAGALSDRRRDLLSFPYPLRSVVGHPVIEDRHMRMPGKFATLDPIASYAQMFSRLHNLGRRHG